MIQTFFDGGIVMWPQLFLLIVVMCLSIWKTIELLIGSKLSKYRLELGLNAILFWGGIAAIIGFFGHFWGIIMAFNEIAAANDISPAIMAQGYSVSLIAVTFGLLILLFSGICWFLLRWRCNQLLVVKD